MPSKRALNVIKATKGTGQAFFEIGTVGSKNSLGMHEREG